MIGWGGAHPYGQVVSGYCDDCEPLQQLDANGWDICGGCLLFRPESRDSGLLVSESDQGTPSGQWSVSHFAEIAREGSRPPPVDYFLNR